MYKRILVAVDGSGTSDRAFREALRLAKEEPQGRLRIVHAVDAVTVNIETPYAWDEYHDALRRTGQAVLDAAQARAKKAGVAADCRLVEVEKYGQRVVDAIVDEARRWRADLLVIGTHGRRGVSHLLLGSVAEGVVRLAPAPVLLVRGS